jgi:nucleotide-binding universal stress UspA family protein
VPVLTLRGPGTPKNGAANIRKILCPTDFSGASQSALDLAVEMGKRLNAHIHLLHVFESPNYLGWETALSQSAPSMQLMQDLRERELEQLEELVARSQRGGANATMEQVDGSPYARIAEFSERFDLVIMGSRGRTGLPRLFLGSVAERTVRLGRCPVICVRGPERSEAPA